MIHRPFPRTNNRPSANEPSRNICSPSDKHQTAFRYTSTIPRRFYAKADCLHISDFLKASQTCGGLFVEFPSPSRRNSGRRGIKGRRKLVILECSFRSCCSGSASPIREVHCKRRCSAWRFLEVQRATANYLTRKVSARKKITFRKIVLRKLFCLIKLIIMSQKMYIPITENIFIFAGLFRKF